MPYNTYKYLNSTTLSAAKGKNTPTHLVNSDTFTLLLKDVLAAQGQKTRYRMGVTVDDGKGNRILDTTILFDAQVWQFPYAGTPYKDGVLIVGLACK
jgi:hypothetical protein